MLKVGDEVEAVGFDAVEQSEGEVGVVIEVVPLGALPVEVRWNGGGVDVYSTKEGCNFQVRPPLPEEEWD